MTGGGRAYAAEFLGTAGLLAVVVGSGIMGERLAQGNDALALLANSLGTGLGLYVLISIFAPLSGAHFNPVVSLAQAWSGALGWKRLPVYLAAQWMGAITGVFLAHLMFDAPILQSASQVRTGLGQFSAEIIATVGLLLTIFGFSRAAPAQLATGVGAFIAAAYWFASSTSFANPAVTTARAYRHVHGNSSAGCSSVHRGRGGRLCNRDRTNPLVLAFERSGLTRRCSVL